MISYDDFAKVEIRAGKILSAEKIPDTDKLLKLTVDFGEVVTEVATVVTGAANGEVKAATTPALAPASAAVSGVVSAAVSTAVSAPRQIISGISLYFPDPAVLVGKTCMFVTNLEPRTIRGYESNGMLFAVSTPEGAFSLLEPRSENGVCVIPPGTKAK